MIEQMHSNIKAATESIFVKLKNKKALECELKLEVYYFKIICKGIYVLL